MDTIGVPAPGVPAVDSILRQVDKIVADRRFSASERQSRLLRLLVEETLRGRSGEISECRLAMEVCGRRESFDPRSDAIVRSELSRIRTKLKDYYEGEGRSDAVRIEFPKRTLIPVFSARAAAEPAAAPARACRIAVLLPACALIILTALGARLAGDARPAGAASAELAGQAASLAVLPFVNEGPDQDLESFDDGLTDEVLHRLSEVEGLSVVSRTSAYQFKGRNADIRQIGQQLNVRAILEGTVRKSEQRLRVTMRLVKAADGLQLSSDEFDVTLDDVFTAQEKIARAIVNDVLAYRAGARSGQLLKRYARDTDAYRLYLRGLYHENRRNEADVREALGLFEQAVAADPRYAPAHSGLADCYVLLTLLAAMPPKEAMPRARAAAGRALQEGPDVPGAHASLGTVLALYDHDWAGADREFQRALELNPSDSAVRERYAMNYLVPRGQLEAAQRHLQRAEELDPASPAIATGLGVVYEYLHQQERAASQYRRALELDPDFSEARLGLASVYEEAGMLRQAERTLQPADSENASAISLEACLEALRGRREQARRRLAQVRSLSSRRYGSEYYSAVALAALGDKGEALAALELAARERCPLLYYANVDPRLDSLRSEPRFGALMRSVGLL